MYVDAEAVANCLQRWLWFDLPGI